VITAVYDAETALLSWPADRDWIGGYSAWLRSHDVDPNVTYRVEHHVIDCPLIRVFQYDRNEHGQKYYTTDYETGDIARRPPFDVLIRSEPPRKEDFG